MKKLLLDKNLGWFKANLHCHSVVSDGTKTPEELKAMYMAQGYSAIAFTDHNVLVDHSDLTDDRFVALNGYEMDITQEGVEFLRAKTCHLCYVALAPGNLTQVCYHREKYLFGNAPKYRDRLRFDETKPDFERHYTPECINEMIAAGRENGFFVTYNHPVWSLEDYADYTAYRGMNAMEMVNYGCVAGGYPDYNEREYDDMLRAGNRIFCTATDDNHNHGNDSFGGFTMIQAERLSYEALTDALVAGQFYSSEGPEIYSLFYEDGKIHIECSPAASVRLNTGVRRAELRLAEGEKGVTEAAFDVQDTDEYVRLTVTGFDGKHANTNAYFVDELMK